MYAKFHLYKKDEILIDEPWFFRCGAHQTSIFSRAVFWWSFFLLHLSGKNKQSWSYSTYFFFRKWAVYRLRCPVRSGKWAAEDNLYDILSYNIAKKMLHCPVRIGKWSEEHLRCPVRAGKWSEDHLHCPVRAGKWSVEMDLCLFLQKNTQKYGLYVT